MEESSEQWEAEAPREASTSTETPQNGTSTIQGDVEIGTHAQATVIGAAGDGESNDVHVDEGNVDVKAENGVRANGVSQGEGGAEGINTVSRTTLHALANGKESESEATDATASQGADGLKTKKRKRAVSPPWQFPTAESTTIKLADGRRASARHNGTPTVGSESEGRARSDSRPTSQSRPPSPPWKKFAVEGPTAVRVDGKRLSTRVNKLPADPEPAKPQRVSPRSKKVVEKVTVIESKKPASAQKPKPQQAPAKAALPQKAARNVVPKKEDMMDTTSPKRTIKELTAQIAAIKYNRSFDAEADNEARTPTKHKRKRSDVSRSTPGRSLSPVQTRTVEKSASRTLSPDVKRSGLKLKLRVAPPTYPPVHPPHPHAMLSSPQRPPRPSLYQVIESFELKEMQQPYMENERGPPDRKEFALRAWKAAEFEAQQRRKILRAAAPNMPLSVQACSVYRDDQVEVSQPFAHRDHLSAHAMFLRQLQVKEKVAHRAQAKKVAYEAVEAWKVRNGPTEEDLIAEADRTFKLIAKQVVVDMRAKWDMVHQYVLERKRQEHEVELERKRQERLDKQLAWSEKMVRRQRGDAGSDVSDMEEYPESGTDEERSGDDDEGEDEEDEEENMSESDKEGGSGKDDEDDEDEGEVEGDALAAYLAQRKAEEADNEDTVMADASGGAEQDDALSGDGQPGPGEAPFGGAEREVTTAASNVDEPEDSRGPYAEPTITTRRQRNRDDHDAPDDTENPELLDDDESTDMDSEDYDSDEDMDSDEDGDDDSGAADSEDEGDNMSSLLAEMLPPERKAELDAALPTPMTSADERNADDDQVEEEREGSEAVEDVQMSQNSATANNEEVTNELLVDEPDPMVVDTTAPVVDTHGTAKRIDALSAAEAPQSVPGTPVSLVRSDGAAKQLIPQPNLLHGELRSYQHAGLDWLASLYKNYTNGILADEMGLGKTIQTIALLAHLAEKLEVWEPHLVVVPTSVVLNWVTEFNKFLPGFRVLAYYGSTEERIRKRSGWANDPHHEDKSKRGYNVVVTSYQIAVKDINAIRNVTWHYLILDEAHNIRNFQTAMYQNLVRLKTSARLLLTGTPLQNSLGELWALLTFLTAGQQQRLNPNASNEATSVGELEEFLNHWREPVKEIFDRGVSALSKGASDIIAQLHTQLRPFMLRRLKSDVEKDLPKKTEHTVVCKLSKRQRQLYQDYMGLADTKAQLARGNAVTAGRVLLSLRRVCNHPDLFDPRPIQTSFAMEESVGSSFGVKETVVRRLLGTHAATSQALVIVKNEQLSKYCSKRSRQLAATTKLQQEAKGLEGALGDSKHNLSTLAGCRAFQRYQQREHVLRQLRDAIRVSEATIAKQPVYGSDLRERLTVRSTRASAYCSVLGRLLITTPTIDIKVGSVDLAAERSFNELQSQNTIVQRSLPTLLSRSEALQSTLTRFAFVTPEATAPVLDLAIPPQTQSLIRNDHSYPIDSDFAHEARIRTTIAFPDSRLLVYDSGKLQRLVHLLRDLQARGSRSLIFSQMTLTLDILERFLNLLNLPYLRLDGSTPVERRQLYSAEFNKPDSKYQVMILSSRAGGVGLNLTGASSVIFYDLDWNPQMDKQCMDRAHRIGQVRDVEVYKMVSEKTVEENILRRANQKSLLDQTVIQEGNFTTDYDLSSAKQSDSDEVGAAIDRLFADGEKAGISAIETIEDKEDVVAAQAARKEEQVEAEEFAENGKAAEKGGEEGEQVMKGHVDDFMVKWMEVLMREGIVQGSLIAAAAKRDRHGRDPGHRAKRKR